MLPKEDDIHLPLLWEIAKWGGKADTSQITKALAEYFKLTQKDLDEVNKSDNRSKWENRVRFARNKLVEFGFISKSIHGVWELTEKGKTIAEIKDPLLYKVIMNSLRRNK